MFGSEEQSPFAQPNSLMAGEIENRVQQIPFQHREELLQNLMWLAQTGETTIPALLRGLDSDSPKVRSSSAWVLGRIADRRVIPYLQPMTKDDNETVRLEAARTLVLLGDLDQSPQLIEGLDSGKKEVRYLCHEALKAATGRDFGYDHLSENQMQRQLAVLNWRQWWGEYSGDTFFAQSYEQRNQLNVAAPMGETQMRGVEQPQQPELQWNDEPGQPDPLNPVDPQMDPMQQDPNQIDPMQDPLQPEPGQPVEPMPDPMQEPGQDPQPAPQGEPTPDPAGGQPQQPGQTSPIGG